MLRRLLFAAALILIPATAVAQAPAFVPVQGFLTDSVGVPIDGETELTVSLYAAMMGGQALFEETQTILVENGFFTFYLGANSVLDLAIFRDNPGVFMGIKVGDENEMAPRLSMGSVPYAGFAQYAESAASAGEVDWSAVVNIPGDIDDGDADALGGLSCAGGQVAQYDGSVWACANVGTDTLAGLSCAEGQLAKYVANAWICSEDIDTDTDTQLSESQVITMVTDNGFLLAGDLATVALSGSYNDLIDQPADADTLASLSCQNGQFVAWTTASGWICTDVSSSDGDITAVYAGSGLNGGGVFDDVTLSLDDEYVLELTATACGTGYLDGFDSGSGSALCLLPVTSLSNGVGLNVDQVNGDVTITVDRSQFDGWYVGQGQSNSVTSDMIVDGQVGPGDLQENYSLVGHLHTGDDISGPVAEATLAYDLDCVGCVSESELDFAAVTDSELAAALASLSIPTSVDGLSGGTITSAVTVSGDFTTTGDVHFDGDLIDTSGPLEIYADGERVAQFETYTRSNNFVAGYSGNLVMPGVYGATVSGGGTSDFGGNPYPNMVTDLYGTVGGGMGNMAGDGSPTVNDASFATVGGGDRNSATNWYATVAGGYQNTVSAGGAAIGGGRSNVASDDNSFVGGGNNNQATANNATIAGGYQNEAAGDYSFVGGGRQNQATGYDSTIPGGHNNLAEGDYSFAAGYEAQATSSGCFVWTNPAPTPLVCDFANRFMVRASGGVEFYTNLAATTGVYLGPGDGAWSSFSDRNKKENFEPVNVVAVLEKVVSMPISTWSYKGQEEPVRHMGPMAQDFGPAFGLGDERLSISTIDADGVALAAIQGLNRKLEQENSELRARLADLAGRIEKIEAGCK